MEMEIFFAGNQTVYLLSVVPSDFRFVKDPPFSDLIGLRVRDEPRRCVTEKKFARRSNRFLRFLTFSDSNANIPD